MVLAVPNAHNVILTLLTNTLRLIIPAQIYAMQIKYPKTMNASLALTIATNAQPPMTMTAA